MKKIVLILMLAFVTFANAKNKKAIDYVDPLMGCTFARWMVFPGASTPFGMVKLSPDNQKKGWKAGYEYKINNIAGFSHLHSWTMAGLLTMPTVGELHIKPEREDKPDLGYRSRFSHDNEQAKVGHYSVFLDDYKIKAELTSTTRAGFQRYTFPKAKDARVLIDLKIPSEYSYELFEAKITKVTDTEIQGYTVQQSHRTAEYNQFKLHFVIRFNKKFKSFNGWRHYDIKRNITENYMIFGDDDFGAFVEFDTKEGEQILMQSGISLVSIEQARLNLETEMNPFNWDFDKAVQANQSEWEKLLTSIEVETDNEVDKKKFYTNMYRVYASRTTWSDVNGKYIDMYEKEQQLEDPNSPVYGCDAFWNTFWNLNQVWTLSQPEIANKWVKSLLEIYDRGGWLPKGPTGIEYSSIMVASHEIPLMVSAYQKGIRNYDVEKFYKAIKHNQMEQGRLHEGGGHVGNRHLASYMKLGYVPYEEGPTSNTMEYAYDDWTVAQIAKALGKTDDYKRFMKRAYNYQNIFYPEKKFVWMKKKDGSWVENFSETGHSTFLGSGFVEGNAWQYTFFVPHDVQGMINLVGKDEFANRLEEGFKQSLPHKFNSEHLDENGLLGMGVLPINHGNQPNMQASYLFNYAGKPWLTQHWVREIMNNFYGDDIYAWPGDEDQGQMGGWFVMSSMGLFQMDGGCSTEPIYEIGSPIFKKSVIHLDKNYYKGGKFTIIANNVSDKNRYVQSAKLDGKPLNKAWFYHSELVDGGTLELEMGDKPNKSWGTKTPPPSMSSVLSAKEKEEILSYDPDAEFMRIWNLGIKAYYNHKKENFESLPNHKGEIIFLGNSLTDGCEWSEMFQNPKIKNRGIGGDDTDGVLGRLDEVIESKPKKIFIMIGTNDLSAGKSVDYIVDNYKKILDNIKAKSPKTKVFIQSELPVDDAIHTTRKNSDLQKINTRLKKIAKKRNLVFIDLYPKFFNGKKLDPKYSYDGLHVNGEGYKVWKSCIEKYVD